MRCFCTLYVSVLLTAAVLSERLHANEGRLNIWCCCETVFSSTARLPACCHTIKIYHQSSVHSMCISGLRSINNAIKTISGSFSHVLSSFLPFFHLLFSFFHLLSFFRSFSVSLSSFLFISFHSSDLFLSSFLFIFFLLF